MLPRPPAKFAAGFSLIELSILLLIIGLLSTTALQTYRQYIIDKTNNTTSASLTQAKQSLSNFVFQHGRLPCPADPSLAPDDVHAGIEFCPTGTAIGCSGFGGGNKVCRINGARPTSDSISPFTPDPVLTGALPYLTLGITETDAMDGWNNKLSYNVTEYMTRAGSGAPGSMSYNDQYGAINIQVYDPVNKAIISGLNPAITGTALPNSYLLAVVSHGSDGRGAYNYYGKMTRACAATGTTRDAENCNGDATFLDRGTGNGSVYSLAPGANYYDDAFVISSLPKDNDKWSMGASGTSFIYTKAWRPGWHRHRRPQCSP
ncbi:MAG: hypothetical protein PW788_05065 [Micavibrio sp.]|nr:hypothetical protein [Micavibrio sp.]